MHRSKGHRLLTDSDADEKDRVFAGETFSVKYLGAVEIPSTTGKGKGCTEEAATQILSQYKSIFKLKSLTSLQFFVSANCVSLSNPSAGFVKLRYPTVNVTYCNTVEDNERAFVFVAKDVTSSSLKAHVVLCDSAAKASEAFSVMREAFIVRYSLYQAKRMDRAGWTTSPLLSQRKSEDEKRNGVLEQVELDSRATGMSANGHVATSSSCSSDANNNNNSFGEFACAATLPQSNGWDEQYKLSNGKNGMCHSNGWSNGDIKSIAEKDCSCTANKLNQTLNGNVLPLAKILLSRTTSRGRSHSLPSDMQNPWAENAKTGANLTNGQLDYSREFLHVTAKENGDDMDGFTQLARERSSSMDPLLKSR